MEVSEPCNVKPYNQNQMELFLPSVRNLIEDGHLYMVVSDVAKELDLCKRIAKLKDLKKLSSYKIRRNK